MKGLPDFACSISHAATSLRHQLRFWPLGVDGGFTRFGSRSVMAK